MSFRALTYSELDAVAGGYWHDYCYYSSGGGQVWDREWIEDQPPTDNRPVANLTYAGPPPDQGTPEFLSYDATTNSLGFGDGWADQIYDSSGGGGGYAAGLLAGGSWVSAALQNDLNHKASNIINNSSDYNAGLRGVAALYSDYGLGYLVRGGVDHSFNASNNYLGTNPSNGPIVVTAQHDIYSIHFVPTLTNIGYGEAVTWAPLDQGSFTPVTQDWGAATLIIDPVTGQVVVDGNGHPLAWPSGINPANIYNTAIQKNGITASYDAMDLFSHNGTWDFQRGGSANGTINHPEFISASTVAIGIYFAAAGVPLGICLTIQNAYAQQHSTYAPTTRMDAEYRYLPALNVQNTIIGYDLAKHLAQKART